MGNVLRTPKTKTADKNASDIEQFYIHS